MEERVDIGDKPGDYAESELSVGYNLAVKEQNQKLDKILKKYGLKEGVDK